MAATGDAATRRPTGSPARKARAGASAGAVFAFTVRLYDVCGLPGSPAPSEVAAALATPKIGFFVPRDDKTLREPARSGRSFRPVSAPAEHRRRRTPRTGRGPHGFRALIVCFRAPQAPVAMPNAFPHTRGAFVPPLVALEIGRLIATRRLPPLPMPLPVLLRARRFQHLAMAWEISARASGLPPMHKDPIDRALVAHSIEQNMPILTNDTQIPRSGVTTIW